MNDFYGHIPFMETLGDRLRRTRLDRGLSQTDVGKSCAVSRASVSQWETGVTTPSQDKLKNVASFLKVEFYWLLTGNTPNNVSRDETRGDDRLSRVPVVGIVEAGVWRETEVSEADPSEYIYMPEDTRYQGMARRAVCVSGDSVDIEIPDGGYAIFIDVADYGAEPKTGQLVIVERYRHQGGLVETTVKEYRMNGHGPELWPKSTNPKHTGPIRLLPDKSDESVEVVIRGIVVGKYVPL